MKVLGLKADNFKNLKAVEITPDGRMVVVGGKNEQGKSSVMDAIWVAIKGRSAAPPKPIRTGEEECRIVLDLGELKVTRKFAAKDGGTYTDSVKVENSAGLRYSKPQEVLDALLGEIGFDPFEFTRLKPKDQAAKLLQMVPLPVDLDELAELDASDFAKRRDVNRDVVQVKAQVDAIPVEEVPADAPDRGKLADDLAGAAEVNTRIAGERARRERIVAGAESVASAVEGKRSYAADLRKEADELDAAALKLEQDRAEVEKELAALPALDEPIDVDAIRRQLTEAESVLAAIERQSRRATNAKRLAELQAESEKLTAAMVQRGKDRNEALAKAKMPIESLAFGLDEKGAPVVQLNGVPFEQASTAEKLKASTSIAIAANPELRVLRITDGSLLDEDSMALLREMAEKDDFQLWVEVVGDPGAVGIIMEGGEVRSAPEEKPKAPAKPKADKAAAPADGALL